MSNNSACIELLRSLLFTLYIHGLCASRRVGLARGQRRWAVLNIGQSWYNLSLFGPWLYYQAPLPLTPPLPPPTPITQGTVPVFIDKANIDINYIRDLVLYH